MSTPIVTAGFTTMGGQRAFQVGLHMPRLHTYRTTLYPVSDPEHVEAIAIHTEERIRAMVEEHLKAIRPLLEAALRGETL